MRSSFEKIQLVAFAFQLLLGRLGMILAEPVWLQPVDLTRMKPRGTYCGYLLIPPETITLPRLAQEHLCEA